MDISTLLQQRTIIDELGVATEFDAEAEIRRRAGFLKETAIRSRIRHFVLGISGGVDSLTAGLLTQAAASQLQAQGETVRFVAMRLPYGIQQDEADAQRCLDVIQPDIRMTVDIKPACDALLSSLTAAGLKADTAENEDLVRGNVKARVRMVAQYAVANQMAGMVVGTDHAAEALMGFFTKYGDGAADLMPLAGLNKRQVRAIATQLGAPAELVMKIPTADLEDLTPLKPDETAFGITYEEIDDFLEGKPVSPSATRVILGQYSASTHKRTLPPGPPPMPA